MIEHTKEPWYTGYRKGFDGMYRQEVFDSTGSVIATPAWHPVKLDNRTTTTDREANARRIVACVNACAGIPIEHLEKCNAIGAVDEIISERNTLKQQRDELLAAAENLVRVKGRHHTEQAYKALEAAIAKVKQ